MWDIRIWQVAVMATLLSGGVLYRSFGITLPQVLLTILVAILSQCFFDVFMTGRSRSMLSSVITAFGVCLLLRSNLYWVHPFVVFVAIASKFILRIRGRHFFNPANLGVLVGLLLPASWISTGQWGTETHVALLLCSLGLVAAASVGSYISSLTFLSVYMGVWASHRVLYLGYEWEDLLHHMGNGAILLFAFFMISDPKTIPAHRKGRVLHASLVAFVAYLWQYGAYWNHGYLWALLFLSLSVPMFDWLYPNKPFEWGRSVELNLATSQRKESLYEI
jgi:Na+-transporting NADH:ubiquinone oxidoreductase subunit NqrB